MKDARYSYMLIDCSSARCCCCSTFHMILNITILGDGNVRVPNKHGRFLRAGRDGALKRLRISTLNQNQYTSVTIDTYMQTHERKKSLTIFGSTSIGRPSRPSGARMSNVCSTDATARKSASFAKWRPGHILRRRLVTLGSSVELWSCNLPAPEAELKPLRVSDFRPAFSGIALKESLRDELLRLWVRDGVLRHGPATRFECHTAGDREALTTNSVR